MESLADNILTIAGRLPEGTQSPAACSWILGPGLQSAMRSYGSIGRRSYLGPAEGSTLCLSLAVLGAALLRPTSSSKRYPRKAVKTLFPREPRPRTLSDSQRRCPSKWSIGHPARAGS